MKVDFFYFKFVVNDFLADEKFFSEVRILLLSLQL